MGREKLEQTVEEQETSVGCPDTMCMSRVARLGLRVLEVG